MLLYLALLDSDEDRELFTQIYEKYRYFLWYLANERLHDAYLAEDAVSEAFIALTRHMDQVTDPESPACRNLLATIVKNKAIDILRKAGPATVDLEELTADPAADTDLLEDCIAAQGYEALLAAIGRLEDKYRVVLEYRYLHDLSEKEIADLMGITPKNVNVRIFRARRKLKQLLTKQEGDR